MSIISAGGSVVQIGSGTSTATRQAARSVQLPRRQVAISEVLPVGTTLGDVVHDASAPAAVTIIDDPSGLFELAAAVQLNTRAELTPGEHTVTIRVENDLGAPVDRTFTITVAAAADLRPTDILLDNATVPENIAVGSIIGALTATSEAAIAEFRIISDPDGKFEVALDDTLRVRAALDYETATAHTVRIRARTAAGKSFDKTFTITVTDVVESGTQAVLSSPSAQAVGATLVLGRATSDQAGGTLYCVASSSATPPTPQQIAGGQKHDGTSAPGFVFQAAVVGEQLVPVVVAPESAVYLHFTHETAPGLLADVVSSGQATTGATGSMTPTASAPVASKHPSGTSVHTISRPPGTVEGDIICASVRFAGGGAGEKTIIAPPNWTRVESFNYGEKHLWAKVAAPSEPDTYDFVSNVALKSIILSWRVSDAAAVEAAGTNLVAQSDPPELTVGWAARNALAIAQFSAARAGQIEITGPPAGYGDFFVDTHGEGTGTADIEFAHAVKAITGTSEDPPQFPTSGTLSFCRAWTIAFAGRLTPTAIVLSSQTVPDGAPADSVVGRMFSDGAVSFEADNIDGLFYVAGNQLRLSATVDNSVAASHDVTITATTAEGGTYQQQFAITVAVDPSEAVAPTAITLSPAAPSLKEGTALGTVAATISSDGTAPVAFTDVTPYEDPEFDQFFEIQNGDQLVLIQGLDYDMAQSHDMTLRAANGKGLHDQVVTIAVTEVVANPPSDIVIDSAAVLETSPIGTVVGHLSASGDEPISFSKVADADGKFTIDGVALKLAAGVSHAAKASHTVTVRADNASGHVERTLTINVVEAVAEGTTLFEADWNSGQVTPDLGTVEKWYGSDLALHTLNRGGLAGTSTESGFTFNLGAHGSEGYDGVLHGTFLRWDGSSGLSNPAKLIFRWVDNANWLILEGKNTASEKFIRIRRMIDASAVTVAQVTNAQVAALFASFTWDPDGSMSSDLGVRIVMDGPSITVYLRDVANGEEQPVSALSLTETSHQTAARHGFIVQAPTIVDAVRYVTIPAPPVLIDLSSTEVRDDAQPGSVVAIVRYTGSPRPTLTKTGDPDGKFNLVGDQLILTGSLDAGADNSHPVTIFAQNSIGTDELVTAITVTAAPPAPEPGDPVTEITMLGYNGVNVTFRWTTPARAGLDPTGVAWVEEPAGGLKGMQVLPGRTTQNGKVINGLMLNPARGASGANHDQGWDERLVFYNPALEVSGTIGQQTLRAGDKLLKAVSETSITTVGRWGSAATYAALHVVSEPPPNATAVLRSTITWPNRNDPSNWYNTTMASFLANRPTNNVPVAWDAFSTLEAHALRFNPVYSMNTADGSRGYEQYFLYAYGSAPGGGSVNLNYGEWTARRVIECAIALCSTGHGYSTSQIERIAWAMLRLGIETADPMQGRRTSNLARGAHFQWHVFPVAMALNLTGRASEMQDAFRDGGFVPGNIRQAFKITQAHHNAGWFQPHNESSTSGSKPGAWLRRTLGSQAGAASNEVLVPKKNSYETGNRGAKIGPGWKVKTEGGKSADVVDMKNTSGSSPWEIVLSGPSPFVAGDVVYFDCPASWVAVGEYEWAEEGLDRPNKVAPWTGQAYRGQQNWGSQLMAVYECGFYDPVLDEAMGYTKRSMQSLPTSSNNYPTTIRLSHDPTNYYYNNHWSWPF